jgi:hypothetical protein
LYRVLQNILITVEDQVQRLVFVEGADCCRNRDCGAMVTPHGVQRNGYRQGLFAFGIDNLATFVITVRRNVMAKVSLSGGGINR